MHPGKKHTKTFRKNLKLCRNDHQQMLERLVKFGHQTTSEENSTRKNKITNFGQTVHVHFEKFSVILSFLYTAPRMSFDHQNWQASLTFVDDHSYKVLDFFEMFWYVSLCGCTKGGCRKTTL